MVSLVRSGPRKLLVSTKDRVSLIEFLKFKLGAVLVPTETVAESSEENHTIIYIINYENDLVTEYEITDSLLIYNDPLNVLSKLYTMDKISPIETIRPGPHTLILRSGGKLEEVVQMVQKEHGGTIGTYEDCVKNAFEDTTIIGVTSSPIYLKLDPEDFYEMFIRIDKDYFKIKQQLRMHSVKYLNLGLEEHDWSEVEIRIYDSYGAYELHYKRLLLVLEALQVGMIIGQSWTKDRPRPLLLIDVYSIRYVSFKTPYAIKKILFALEYLEDGTRIVDYDLFEGKDKIQWSMLYKKEKNIDKKTKSRESRKEIFEMLPNETIAELLELEKQILQTRY